MTHGAADGHGHAGGHHGHGGVGPLVDEAALLLTAVEDKLQAWQAAEDRGAGGPVELPQPCPECGTVPGAACTGCPVCRLVAAVRGERPEVTARMVDGALTIVRALRTLLPDAAAESPPPATPDGPTPSRGPEPPSADGRSDHVTSEGDPVAPAADGPDAAGGRTGDGTPPHPAAARPPPAPDGSRRPGASTPPRPAPRPPRPAGLQRIDIR